MKSVMHEASSVAKAIEQAWLKAGHPQEFSIKILEEPQKNFLGFTTRSAKVALYFEIHLPAVQQPSKPSQPKPKPYQPSRQEIPKAQPEPRQTEQKPQETQKPRREYKPLWNDATIAYVNQWLKDTLSTMNIEPVDFTIEPSDFYLKILFKNNIAKELAQEKKLFASFATLIMESLKRNFKSSFRGHKIILIPASTQS